MKRTRLSLFYLAGYLFPTGLALLFAPQWLMKMLFASHEYSDAFPQFSGVLLIALLIALGIMVLYVIRYGNRDFYRMTLIRATIWICTLGLCLHTRETFFPVVLGVVGLGIVLTGSMYLTESLHVPPEHRSDENTSASGRT